MADISTGRQRGIVPFVDETTGRLPDQYLPQGVIDLQGDLEQAVTNASASATEAKASAASATQSASAAAQSAESASGDAAAAKASADGAASSASAAKASETAAASSATAAANSEAAAKASETAASQSAQTATEQVSSIGDSVERAAASATAAQQSASDASASASAAKASETNAVSSASAAKVSETNAAASATAAQQAVDGFGLTVGSVTTGEPGTDASVDITKDGAKYTADFTIPRGNKGEPSPVVHDDTLTGNGTSGTPLGAALGSMLNPYGQNAIVDADQVNNGLTVVSYNTVNLPVASQRARWFIVSQYAGYGSDVNLQLLVTGLPENRPQIFVRSKSNEINGGWTEFATKDDIPSLSNYVPFSTYQALEARVQALEAKLANK